MVANCNIMLTNKVKNKNIMLYKWFRLIEYIIFTMVSVLQHTLLLSLIYDTHETNIHIQTQLYQTSYWIYQSINSGPLDDF